MPGRAITQVCPQCQMPLVLPATFAGKTVPCSRCGHGVLVSDGLPTAPKSPPPAASVVPPHLAAKLALPPEAAAPPAPQPPAPLPPHLAKLATAVKPMSPASETATPEELEPDAEAPQPRSCFMTGCLAVGVGTIVLSGILGVVLLSVFVVRKLKPPGDDGGNVEAPTRGPQIDKSEYKDASRVTHNLAGVAVRIDRVEVGKVDFRSKGEILQTATPNYLIINVNIRNKSREEPVLYQSWYDNKFENEAGQQQDVQLVDDNGVELELFRVPEAENVKRISKSETDLPMGDDITDSLVFKLPDGYIEEPIPALYLKLPVAAVGDRGFFRLKIPITMIVRRDK